MKRIFCLALCIVLTLTLVIPSYAAEGGDVIFSEQTVLEDGTVITDEVIVISSARSVSKTAVRRKTITRSDTVIGIIAFQATFSYDGNSAYVTSKAVIQTDTYEGWSYKQTSFTSNGNTVTLEGKLTKLLILNDPFTMTMTCDKNGNISAT